jgi:histidyl-tRNA synthetase
VVRGLAYYTGIVYEAFDLRGEIKRSILGGGRYDNLMSDVGGDPLPATGFAMGDLVITLLLEEHGLLPKELAVSPAAVLVTVFDENSLLDSLALAAELRRQGIATACYPEPARLPKQFKYADRQGMLAALVMGPDEKAAGTVTLKNLATGEQRSLSRGEIAPAMRQLLDSARPS